jgi:poly(A) polymerase
LSHASTKNLFEKVEFVRSSTPFLLDFECQFPTGDIYLVGGAVRDFLLGRDTKDIDFLVRAVNATDLRAFLSQYGHVSFVGKNFGVYKFMPTGSGVEIDVALPRTEQSFSHKGIYRDFKIETDPNLPVEEDLKRRDFTINAIAVDMKRSCLIDPFGGIDDLEAKKIRAVGDPYLRFSEDYSRLLRGLRFAGQLGFLFEQNSWAALCQTMGQINSKREDGTFVVPRETIAKEFLRALVCDPVRLFDLWDESGAFTHLIPELLVMKGCPQPVQFHAEGDVWIHTRLALSQLMTSAFSNEFGSAFDAQTALSVLLHDIGKPLTLQTPEKDGVDRIRFNNHDHVGARLSREIVCRLKLTSLPKESRYAVDEDDIAWLIEKHLILVHGEVDLMRASTIEKYFLRSDGLGQRLMQLIFCDGNATVPEAAPAEMRHYYQLKERLKKIKALSQNRAAPPTLLSGKEVMAALGIGSGPRVGSLLARLREEQLSGRMSNKEEALAFLKSQTTL